MLQSSPPVLVAVQTSVTRPVESRCRLSISTLPSRLRESVGLGVAPTPAPAGAGDADAGWGTDLANVTVTRRFLRRPCSVAFDATGSDEPCPAAVNVTPGLVTSDVSRSSTAWARALDSGLLMASFPVVSV